MSELPGFTFAPIIRKELVRLIPKELIESVKGRTFTPEQFYTYQEGQIGNPFNMLHAVIDENKIIQGFLWAERNMLDGSLFVNTFSISKPFWGKGKALLHAISFLKELQKKLNAPRSFWVTTNPKFFKKYGFDQSKNVLMEYENETGDPWDNHAEEGTLKKTS